MQPAAVAQAEAPSEARPSRTHMLHRCHALSRPFSACRSRAAALTLASHSPPPQVEQLRQRLERSEAARNKLRQAASAGLAANAELQKELEACMLRQCRCVARSRLRCAQTLRAALTSQSAKRAKSEAERAAGLKRLADAEAQASAAASALAAEVRGVARLALRPALR